MYDDPVIFPGLGVDYNCDSLFVSSSAATQLAPNAFLRSDWLVFLPLRQMHLTLDADFERHRFRTWRSGRFSPNSAVGDDNERHRIASFDSQNSG